MNLFCISTVVDAAYMAYVPFFVYCLRSIYGNSIDIKIFVRDKYKYDKYGLSFDIVPEFDAIPKYKYNSISLRFLVPPSHYKNYEHVWITDIDIMAMPEEISIVDRHRGEMAATRLSYSNSLRHAGHYMGYQSLSGLHLASAKWFIETEKLRQFYLLQHQIGTLGTYREYDGVMLYRMALNSGAGVPEKGRLTTRHHGIHLASFDRLFPNNKEKWETRVSTEWKQQWLQIIKEPLWKRMWADISGDNKSFVNQVNILNGWCRE